jgi:dynein heavy chain
MKQYLTKRRMEIPRFYFLSDEDIFEILGKTKDPNCLNKNIKKMFEGIKALDFNPKTSKGKYGEYTHMISSCGETVEFTNNIEINGDLNQILNNVEKEMKKKLQIDLFKSLIELSSSNIINNKDLEKLENWLRRPGQILITSSQI